MKLLTVIVALSLSVCAAQTAKPATGPPISSGLLKVINDKVVTPQPPDSPPPISSVDLPDSAVVKLLETQHQLDEVSSKQKDLQIQVDRLYDQFMAAPEMKKIQRQMDDLNDQQAQLRATMDQAKVEALKAAKVDPAKFDVDVPGLEKAIPKPQGPQQAKAK